MKLPTVAAVTMKGSRVLVWGAGADEKSARSIAATYGKSDGLQIITLTEVQAQRIIAGRTEL